MTSRVHVASPVQNGQVRCFAHPGTVLPRRLSQTQKNPNRAFYSCEVSDGTDGETCNFFKWEDELSMVTQDYGPNQTQNQPNTSPTPSPQRTAASQTRLAAILRAQGQLPSGSEVSAGAVKSTSPAHNSISSSPSSSRPTTISQTSQTSPFIPSWCSTQPSASTSVQPAAPPVKHETEEKRSMSPPPQGAVAGFNPKTPSKRSASTAEHELGPVQKRPNTSAPTPSPQRTAASQTRLAAILRAQAQIPSELPAESETSPSTLQSTSVAHNYPASSASSSRPAAISQTSPLLPSWRPVQSSSESPQPVTPPPVAEKTACHWPPQTPPSVRVLTVKSEDVGRTREPSNNILGASMNARLDDPFNCPTGSVTGPGGSEPRGPVASYSDAEQIAVADEYLDYSNRVAEYIRQLERRLQAAEKSNDAKARRIEKLNEEIDRLKIRNGELESRLN
ncbi:hypothetical protein K438DRAFT_2011934 [Mycena galopus ATCC 62051]|nr:hypothetical protein K438DRAFT_2011934 [Mycena galopus ATCC 62051]